MEKSISVILVLVGLIHLVPVTGVLGSERLLALYGERIEDPNLLILMSHRSVLFGLLGLFLISAAWKPEWQVAALIAGLVSMLSFVILARLTGNYNASINKVVWVDLVASVALLAASVLYWLKHRIV